MNCAKVSILIPVYNRKKYIAECIQSALDQSFVDNEIVVVDNASDDGTWAICQQFAAKYSHVRVFRNDRNIGPVGNWIRCVQEAHGEYSKMLFSDDLLEPDCVRRMLQPFENCEVGFVFCAAKVGASKELSTIAYSLASDSLIDHKKYLSLLLENRVSVSPGAVMLRTKDLVKNLHMNFPTATPRSFWRHGAGPDVMIMLLTMTSYQWVMHVKDPLVFFRSHADSFSIGNTNNEVTLGYVSSFSFYLKTYESATLWFQYVIGTWMSKILRERAWTSLRYYLQEFEGIGSFWELIIGLVFVPYVLLLKIFK